MILGKMILKRCVVTLVLIPITRNTPQIVLWGYKKKYYDPPLEYMKLGGSEEGALLVGIGVLFG